MHLVVSKIFNSYCLFFPFGSIFFNGVEKGYAFSLLDRQHRTAHISLLITIMTSEKNHYANWPNRDSNSWRLVILQALKTLSYHRSCKWFYYNELPILIMWIIPTSLHQYFFGKQVLGPNALVYMYALFLRWIFDTYHALNTWELNNIMSIILN